MIGKILDASALAAFARGNIAATRGWPALTADPERLQRIDPDISIDLI